MPVSTVYLREAGFFAICHHTYDRSHCLSLKMVCMLLSPSVSLSIYLSISMHGEHTHNWFQPEIFFPSKWNTSQ